MSGLDAQLMEAVNQGQALLCVELLALGADVNAVHSSGNTALHLAVMYRHASTCEVLLERGANTQTPNEFGLSALHLAASRNCVHTCRALLEHDAKTGAVDIAGWNPLHLAAQSGFTAVCAVLLEYGADPLVEVESHDSALDSALDMAVKYGFDDCAAAMRSSMTARAARAALQGMATGLASTPARPQFKHQG